MKKVLSLLVAVTVLLSVLAGATLSASAAFVKPLPASGIAVNADLSEWTNIEKLPLSVYDSATGTFTPSETEYVQFAFSGDSLFFTLVANNVGNTMEGLLRDHFRLTVLLPSGEIGTFYSDEDNWYAVSDAASWWGYTGTNAFQNAGTYSLYTRNDTQIIFEGQAVIAPELRENLVDGAEWRVSLQYFDHMACNTGAYDGARWASYGATVITPITANAIQGELTLGNQPVAYPTATAAPIASEADITIDGTLTEWADIARVPLYDYDGETYTPSETEYVQFAWSADSLYFTVVADNVDNTMDGLLRDHFRLTLAMPGGVIGTFYSDEDNWYNVANAASWWGYTGTNAFSEANTFSKFTRTDTQIIFEGRACIAENLRSQLASGNTLKVSLQYFDHMACNTGAYNGAHWAAFGAQNITPISAAAIRGVLKLESIFPPATATAVPAAGTTPTGCIDVDGNLTDWSCIARQPMYVYDSESGKFVLSETEYVQFAYSSDSLYFSLVANDVENTLDGLLRDHIRFVAVLPNGEIGLFYSDEDNWHSTADAAVWWGYTGANAFQAASTFISMVHENGQTIVEGRAMLAEEQRAQLTPGAKLNVSLQYFDHMACNTGAYDGAYWATYGATAIMPTSIDKNHGVMTLGEATAHTWVDATCQAPKTCSVCGTTEGEIGDHTYVDGACSVCGEADPSIPVGPVEETLGGVTLTVIEDNGAHKLVVSGEGALADWSETAAYTYKETLTEVVIEEGITALPYGAFQGFKALASVSLPTTVTALPTLAFSGCSALTTIDLTNIKTIGNKAFMAAGLTEVTVPGGVTMDDAVFYGCADLVTANLGNVYVNANGALRLQVPAQTFVNCTALKNVTFGNKLNTINAAAFKNTGLESITIPGNIKTISSNAFMSNAQLTTLVLEEGVRTLGYNAFAACVALEEVVLPDSVTGASTGVFYSCYGLQKVTVGAGLAATGKDMFLDNRALTEVTLSEGLVTLDNRTFFKDAQLTSVTLPESLTTVNKLAFFACYNLSEIKIPANVTTIGDNAFDGCKAMKTVTIDSATIAADLTTNKAAGCLVRYAETVYVKADIESVGAYITDNFTNAGTVTVDGVDYVTYTK